MVFLRIAFAASGQFETKCEAKSNIIVQQSRKLLKRTMRLKFIAILREALSMGRIFLTLRAGMLLDNYI